MLSFESYQQQLHSQLEFEIQQGRIPLPSFAYRRLPIDDICQSPESVELANKFDSAFGAYIQNFVYQGFLKTLEQQSASCCKDSKVECAACRQQMTP